MLAAVGTAAGLLAVAGITPAYGFVTPSTAWNTARGSGHGTASRAATTMVADIFSECVVVDG